MTVPGHCRLDLVLGIAVVLSPFLWHNELVPDPPLQRDVEHKVAPVHTSARTDNIYMELLTLLTI